jgi:Rrf2 family protein
VDLSLSRRGDYVTRAALNLARAFGADGYQKIREVVAGTEIPPTFAAQILADLVRAGLAASKAGKKGGYRLTREPDQVSLLEVIEAAEGPLRPDHCALGTGPCRWDQVCPLHETWSEATTRLRTVLSEASLGEVAARDEAIARGTYSVPPDSHRRHPTAVDVTDRVQVELGGVSTHAALARIPTRLGHLLAASDAEISLAAGGPRRLKTPPSSYLVSWRLADPGQASRFEGELTVSEVDDQRSELELSGTWRADEPGLGFTAKETRQRAQRAARTFLRNLARTLETL